MIIIHIIEWRRPKADGTFDNAYAGLDEM